MASYLQTKVEGSEAIFAKQSIFLRKSFQLLFHPYDLHKEKYKDQIFHLISACSFRGSCLYCFGPCVDSMNFSSLASLLRLLTSCQLNKATFKQLNFIRPQKRLRFCLHFMRAFVISYIVRPNDPYSFQIYLQSTFLSSNNSKNIQGTVKSLLKALLKFQLISASLVLLGNHYNEVIDAQKKKYTQLKLLKWCN